jgi:hypothetical protein
MCVNYTTATTLPLTYGRTGTALWYSISLCLLFFNNYRNIVSYCTHITAFYLPSVSFHYSCLTLLLIFLNILTMLWFYLTFIGPCIANIFAQYNQEDATFHNLFIYFCKTLYMFQTGFTSIISSSKLHTASGSCQTVTATCCCMCSFEFLMMNGKPFWNM